MSDLISDQFFTDNELPTLTPGVMWGKIKACTTPHTPRTQNTGINTGQMCSADKKINEKMGGSVSAADHLQTSGQNQC